MLNTPRWLPNALAGLVLLAFAAGCLYRVHRIVRAAERAERLVANDSQHYLAIARSFALGDFSMSYVKERAHRQPLYPLLLTPVMATAPDNLFLLAAVNVVLGTLVLAAAYLIAVALFGRRWLALVLTMVLAANQFLSDHSTEHLLTEPLHLLLMLGVIYGFVRYLREQRTRWLVLTVLAAGLDYLTRPNGLFVAASALAVLGFTDLRAIVRSAPVLPRKEVRTLAARYGLALAVLIGVTTPSWLPRAVHIGNPLHHGYLNNYLWVDTYAEAHRAENFVRYTWRDYAASHNAGDAAKRWAHGIKRVVVEIPPGLEGLPVLYSLALAGCLVALIFGPAPFRWLLLSFILQMLPLIWTNLPNPSPRIPYGAMLPFEVIFAGFLMAWLAERSMRTEAAPSTTLRSEHHG